MSKSLFEIEKEYLDLVSEIENADGELSEEVESKLTINEKELESKIKAYHYIITTYKGEINTIDEEIKRLSSLKKIKDNTINRLRDNILTAVNIFGYDGKTGNKKLDFDTLKLYTRFTRPVIINIPDEDFIEKFKDTEFVNVKTTYSVDRRLIKDRINQGEQVLFCNIDEVKQTVIIQ